MSRYRRGRSAVLSYLIVVFSWFFTCLVYAVLICLPMLAFDLPEVFLGVATAAFVESARFYHIVNERHFKIWELKQTFMLSYRSFADQFQMPFQFKWDLLWVVLWTASEKLLSRVAMLVLGLIALGLALAQFWIGSLVVGGLAYFSFYFIPQLAHQFFNPGDLEHLVKNAGHYKALLSEKRYRENPPRLSEYPQDHHDDRNRAA
jgi:hypothetical protein